MYSLVKFVNGDYYITKSVKVKNTKGKSCLVKYNGGNYEAVYHGKNDSRDFLQGLMNDMDKKWKKFTTDTNNSENKSKNIPKRKCVAKKTKKNHSRKKNRQVPGRCSTPKLTYETIPRLSDQINLSKISDKTNQIDKSDEPIPNESDLDKKPSEELSNQISVVVTTENADSSFGDFNNTVSNYTIETSDPPSAASEVIKALGNDFLDAVDKEFVEEHKNQNLLGTNMLNTILGDDFVSECFIDFTPKKSWNKKNRLNEKNKTNFPDDSVNGSSLSTKKDSHAVIGEGNPNETFIIKNSIDDTISVTVNDEDTSEIVTKVDSVIDASSILSESENKSEVFDSHNNTDFQENKVDDVDKSVYGESLLIEKKSTSNSNNEKIQSINFVSENSIDDAQSTVDNDEDSLKKVSEGNSVTCTSLVSSESKNKSEVYDYLDNTDCNKETRKSTSDSNHEKNESINFVFENSIDNSKITLDSDDSLKKVSESNSVIYTSYILSESKNECENVDGADANNKNDDINNKFEKSNDIRDIITPAEEKELNDITNEINLVTDNESNLAGFDPQQVEIFSGDNLDALNIANATIEFSLISETTTQNNSNDSTYILSATDMSTVPVELDECVRPTYPLLKNIKTVKLNTLSVPVSRIDGIRTKKVNYCPFCHKSQTKFGRHIETVHRDTPEAQRLSQLKPKDARREEIFRYLRNYGNYLYNMNPALNKGTLITCRQAQAKYGKKAEDYIPCSTCKGFFSKKTIRLHYGNCNKDHKKGVREIMVEGKKILCQIHYEATDEFAQVFHKLREDDIKKSIQDDRLLILYGNRLTSRYTEDNQPQMIRGYIRLLAKLKNEMIKLDPNITDFASILDPEKYNIMVEAAKICASYDPEIRSFKCPGVTTTIFTRLREVIDIFLTDCIKNKKKDLKELAEDFSKVLNTEYPIVMNKKALSDQVAMKLNKPVILPTKEDIKILYSYLSTKSQQLMSALSIAFSYDDWKELMSCSLIMILTFNRKRPGDIERMLIEHYDKRRAINKDIDPDLYRKLSAEGKSYAKQYQSIATRGKKGRTVPVLINATDMLHIDFILKKRVEAGVHINNKYVFGIPTPSNDSISYLRACDLMRRYSSECGASNPKTLRATLLRKQVATNTAMLRVEDNDVQDLADFMGHDKAIHTGIYRQPLAVKEITIVSKLLNAAMGSNLSTHATGNDENNSGDDNRAINDDGNNDTDDEDSTDSMTDTEFDNQNLLNYNQVPEQNSYMSTTASSFGATNNSSNSSANSTKSPPTKKQKKIICRKQWSIMEKNAVMKIVGLINQSTKLPSLEECRREIKKYKVLSGRTPEQLKSYISNQKQLLKR